MTDVLFSVLQGEDNDSRKVQVTTDHIVFCELLPHHIISHNHIALYMLFYVIIYHVTVYCIMLYYIMS